LVISFYTPDNEYAKWAETLKRSVERCGYEHEIRAVSFPECGTWSGRCAHKGPYILDAMKRHNRPLLWLDADSEMIKAPVLFDDPPFDFAVTQIAKSGRLKSGTMYVAPAAMKLLERTARLCVMRPNMAHEKNLTAAWRVTRREYRTRILPRGYNHVPKNAKNHYVGHETWDGVIWIQSNAANGSGYSSASFGKKLHSFRFRTLVTSFYADIGSNHYYSDCAKRLALRCDRLHMRHDIRQRKGVGEWNANCKLKPAYILEVLEERNEPLLWLDVDSILYSVPWLVDAIEPDVDVAFVRYKGSKRVNPPLTVRDATLFFGNTSGARMFLAEWKRRCERGHAEIVSDHHYLDWTRRYFLEHGGLKFGELPGTYAFVRGEGEQVTRPVIGIGLAAAAPGRAEAMLRFRRRTQEQVIQAQIEVEP